MATTTKAPKKTPAKPAAKASPNSEVKYPIGKKQLVAARTRLQEISESLEKLREEQLKIRLFVADALHNGEEGSKTITIDGVKVGITRKLNRSISVEDAERLGQEQGDIALAAIRWKPEVVTSAYREHSEILDDYIVTKPGPPEVTFK
jgi:hypothetical protein